jgi:hypothetical protein
MAETRRVRVVRVGLLRFVLRWGFPTDSYRVGFSGLFQRARRADRGSLSHGSHYASPSGLRRRTLGAISVGCHLPIPTTNSIAKPWVGKDAWVARIRRYLKTFEAN